MIPAREALQAALWLLDVLPDTAGREIASSAVALIEEALETAPTETV